MACVYWGPPGFTQGDVFQVPLLGHPQRTCEGVCGGQHRAL